MATSEPMATVEECSDLYSTSEQETGVRHVPQSLPETSEYLISLNNQPGATAVVSKSGDGDRVQVDDDHSGTGYSRQVSESSQDSVDKLAAEYSEMGSSSDSDSEQSNHINADTDGDDKKVHRRHAKKIARRYLETKYDNVRLKTKYDIYWTFAVTLKNEIGALVNQLEQRSIQGDEERTSLLMQLKQKKASMQMLKYGVQGKCGVCSKTCKIIESHPYTRVVLETAFGANYSGIFDLQEGHKMQPSSCRWKHMCAECDRATGEEENKFKNDLESVLDGSTSIVSEEISLSHADLLHIYIFRALLRNVDIHHYIPDCEKNQVCTCSDLLHPLNDFLKRAHHLSKPIIWKDRPNDPETKLTPSEAGMLYHVCHTEVPPSHWIEFPLICKVHFESEQRSHHIIFAQIPPFYWAFPLPLHTEQDVPDCFSEDLMTSADLVKAHYKEVTDIADQLSKYFELIIAEINKELEQRRKQLLLDDRLRKWQCDLNRDKEEIVDKGQKLETEKQQYMEMDKDLSDKLEEIKEKREKNKQRTKEIQKQIEIKEKQEKETRIARAKQKLTGEVEGLAAGLRQIVNENQELNKTETKYTDDLEENASNLERICGSKLRLIQESLCAELKPKLIIGYFRTESRCCLEVKIA